MTPEEKKRRVRGVVEQEERSANDRFKDHFGSFLAGGLILATLAHLALFELFPTMRAADIEASAGATETVELPPEVKIPPPPQRVARPATPKVAAAAEVDEDVTISKTSFEANPVEQLPPPPKDAGGGEGGEDRPAFIPYDVPPELKNPGEVQDALKRSYPDHLRKNRIGGRVVLWVYVDEEGRVQKSRVQQSSGYPALDRAAKEVAAEMRFSPAMNRDRKTAVWVQQAIEFEVR